MSFKQISLAVIVNPNKEVLLIQRSVEEKSSSGATLSWVFPGGEILEGETPEEAVVREVFEETGYKVTINNKISERDHPQFPAHIIYYECQLENPRETKHVNKHEVTKLLWCESRKINEYITSDLDSKVEAKLKHLSLVIV